MKKPSTWKPFGTIPGFHIKSKKAQFDQAFLTYQSTVLTAFKEVEDALVAFAEKYGF
jgi:outer membrane protein TolC